MIPSSQIWDSAQRNFPNFRPPGRPTGIRDDDSKKGGSSVEVYVNRFKESMRRQKLSGFSYCLEKCCTYSVRFVDLSIAKSIKTFQEYEVQHAKV